MDMHERLDSRVLPAGHRRRSSTILFYTNLTRIMTMSKRFWLEKDSSTYAIHICLSMVVHSSSVYELFMVMDVR